MTVIKSVEQVAALTKGYQDVSDTMKIESMILSLKYHLMCLGSKEDCKKNSTPLKHFLDANQQAFIIYIVGKYAKDDEIMTELLDLVEMVCVWYEGSKESIKAMSYLLSEGFFGKCHLKRLSSEEELFAPWIESLESISHHLGVLTMSDAEKDLIVARIRVIKAYSEENEAVLYNSEILPICITLIETITGEKPVLGMKSTYETLLLCVNHNGSAKIHGHPELRRILGFIRDNMKSLMKNRELDIAKEIDPMDHKPLKAWIYANLSLQQYVLCADNFDILVRKQIIEILIASISDKHVASAARQHSILTLCEFMRIDNEHKEKVIVSNCKYAETVVGHEGIYNIAVNLLSEGRKMTSNMDKDTRELFLFPRIEFLRLIIQNIDAKLEHGEVVLGELLSIWDYYNKTYFDETRDYKTLKELHRALEYYAGQNDTFQQDLFQDQDIDKQDHMKHAYSKKFSVKKTPKGLSKLEKQYGLDVSPIETRAGAVPYMKALIHYLKHEDEEQFVKEFQKAHDEVEGKTASKVMESRKSVLFTSGAGAQNFNQSHSGGASRKSFDAATMQRELQADVDPASTSHVTKNNRQSFFTSRELIKSNQLSNTKNKSKLSKPQGNDFDRRKSFAAVEANHVVGANDDIHLKLPRLLKYILLALNECVKQSDKSCSEAIRKMVKDHRLVWRTVGALSDYESSPTCKALAAQLIFTLCSFDTSYQQEFFDAHAHIVIVRVWKRCFRWRAGSVSEVITWSALALSLMASRNMKNTAILAEHGVMDMIAPLLHIRSATADFRSVNALCAAISSFSFKNDLAKSHMTERNVPEALIGVLGTYTWDVSDNQKNAGFKLFFEAVGNLSLLDSSLKCMLGVEQYSIGKSDKAYEEHRKYYCGNAGRDLIQAYTKFLGRADNFIDRRTMEAAMFTLKNVTLDRRYLALFNQLQPALLDFLRRECSRNEVIHCHMFNVMANILQSPQNAKDFTDNDGIATIVTTLPFLTDQKAEKEYPAAAKLWVKLPDGSLMPQSFLCASFTYLIGELAKYKNSVPIMIDSPNNLWKVFSSYLRYIIHQNTTPSFKIDCQYDRVMWQTQFPLTIMRTAGAMLIDEYTVQRAADARFFELLCDCTSLFESQSMLIYEANRVILRAISLMAIENRKQIDIPTEKEVSKVADKLYKEHSKHLAVDDYVQSQKYIKKHKCTIATDSVKEVTKKCDVQHVAPFYLFSDNIANDPKLTYPVVDVLTRDSPTPLYLKLGIKKSHFIKVILENRRCLSEPKHVRMQRVHESGVALFAYVCSTMDHELMDAMIRRDHSGTSPMPSASASPSHTPTVALSRSEQKKAEKNNNNSPSPKTTDTVTRKSIRVSPKNETKVATFDGTIHHTKTDDHGKLLDAKAEAKYRDDIVKEMFKHTKELDRNILGNGTLPLDESSVVCILANQLVYFQLYPSFSAFVAIILSHLMTVSFGDAAATTLISSVELLMAMNRCLHNTEKVKNLARSASFSGASFEEFAEGSRNALLKAKTAYMKMLQTYGKDESHLVFLLELVQIDSRHAFRNIIRQGLKPDPHPEGVYELNENSTLNDNNVPSRLGRDLVGYLRTGGTTQSTNRKGDKCFIQFSASQDLRGLNWYFVPTDKKFEFSSKLDWNMYGSPIHAPITKIAQFAKIKDKDLIIELPPTLINPKKESITMHFKKKDDRDAHYLLFSTWRQMAAFGRTMPIYNASA